MSVEFKNCLVVEVTPTIDITENFQKRNLIVEYAENPQYPQFISFEVTQKRCDYLDDLNPGDLVEVTFDIKGRKYQKNGETRYFNSLQAWRISKFDSLPSPDFAAGQRNHRTENTPTGSDDKIPF